MGSTQFSWMCSWHYPGEFPHLEKGYGLANLTYDIPISSQSVFRICSLSKQFTAACVALLEEANKLDRNTPIRDYLFELPEYVETITPQHLIHHTSGLMDYIELLDMAGIYDLLITQYANDDIFDLICSQKRLAFQPGSRFAYSN